MKQFYKYNAYKVQILFTVTRIEIIWKNLQFDEEYDKFL